MIVMISVMATLDKTVVWGDEIKSKSMIDCYCVFTLKILNNPYPIAYLKQGLN